MKRSWKSYAGWATELAWIIVFATIILLGLTSQCQAKDELPDVSGDCAPEVEGLRRAIIVNEGVAGVWFQRDVVVCMTQRLSALPLFADRVRLLEQRLSLSDERHELMARQVALAEQGEQAAADALENAMRLTRRAESRAARERTLRWLWATLGVVITGAVFALSVWGYHRLDQADEP